jgi:EAL domain-containing protein (putative c-di-GMP-specific phosphodiesterase class I)/GGDEF domain-containing protein
VEADAISDAPAEHWTGLATRLSHAFQPVVHARTGHCFGYEALLRGVEPAGFGSVAALLDAAYRAGALAGLEAMLCELAIARFAALPHFRSNRLFLNLDARVLEDRGFRPSCLFDLVGRHGLHPEAVSVEIREPVEARWAEQAGHILAACRAAGFQIAIDDYGTGLAGLKLLDGIQPNFLKIDRSVVADIDRDERRRNLVDTIVRYAHALGISVVAEGVETEREFFCCRDLGCELIQGHLIAGPTEALEALLPFYDGIAGLNRRDRRFADSDERLFEAVTEPLEPLPLAASMSAVLDYFRRHPDQTLAPVVDGLDRPIGILRDRDLKIYVYSQYGSDLLKNRAMNKSLRSFLHPCLTAEVRSKAERILELFSSNKAEDGVLMTRNGVYAGFLSAPALIRLAHEKNVIAAREQNPLSKLPGNTRIVEFASAALLDTDQPCAFVYFDFDNFKPFNDTLGFRQGDRAILMFAERLQRCAAQIGGFCGHIGGDDFFLGVAGGPVAGATDAVEHLLARFRSDAESLYDAEARAAQYLVGKDRDGNPRRFPLLAASAVLVWLPSGRGALSIEQLARVISDNKQRAKQSPRKLVVVEADDGPVPAALKATLDSLRA